MRRVFFSLLLAGAVTTQVVRADGPEQNTAANDYNLAAENWLFTASNGLDGEKSHKVSDPEARGGFALLADPNQRPGKGNIWFGYTYHQGPGRLQARFRLKVADNTIAMTVATIRGDINGGELKNGSYAKREIKGTDFARPETYQEFALEIDKGELGFGDWAVSTEGLTKLTFDGISVAQLSKFDVSQLFNRIVPPEKPSGLRLQTFPFIVHETHGLYMEYWGVRQAVEALAASSMPGIRWDMSYVKVGGQYTSLEAYPIKWEDLYRHQIVVLNNTPAKCVTIVGTVMLKKFVQDGGCLVMMGDTHAFAAGNWNESQLAALLPITLINGKDLRHPAVPLAITPCVNTLRTGLDWAAKPVTLYYHEAKVKPGAEVLLTAGGTAVAVEQRVGKGRVVVLLASVCGEPTPELGGGIPFWEWADWPKLMSRILAGK